MTRRGLLTLVAVSALGCRQDMHDQPKLKPYASSDFFADARASRQLVAGTIARGQLREDALVFTGKLDGKFAAATPFPLTLEVSLGEQLELGFSYLREHLDSARVAQLAVQLEHLLFASNGQGMPS